MGVNIYQENQEETKLKLEYEIITDVNGLKKYSLYHQESPKYGFNEPSSYLVSIF